MSFSQKTKNELSKLPLGSRCCSLAELAALVRMCGTIQINSGKNINLKFSTENASIARRIFSILKKSYDIEIEVMVRKNRQLKKNNNYLIVINDKKASKEILLDVEFLERENINIFNPDYKINKNIIKNRCCKRAYIRGSFLGGGSISNPEKTYHLEMVTNNKEHAEDLSKTINTFDLNSKIVLRKENYIVYIKEGEKIVDVLNIMGAHQALLHLEDIRVLKDIRNNINRIVNCETANLGKTISASLRQINDIKFIDDHMGIHKLPKGLREISILRLENPDASLKELGKMLSNPVGKSGVNHRFRKIGEIAKELGGN
ncbi:MAG: DNA-binding protein WhiA [Tissierella sp.]|uniref:DNA-binding protein WhiA n=1 Tax=Tissierella sp. TaxID=41274 RepID=UPI003F9A009D